MGNTSAANMSGPEAQFIDNEVKQNCVVIFSKSSCPYCRASKNLFQQLGVEFKAIELDKRSDCSTLQDILERMTGARTVPRVFVNGRCIGGNSETKALNDQGKLLPLIQNCGQG